MRQGWETRELREVAFVGSGNPAPQNKELFEDGIYPFIRTSDVGQVRKGLIDKSIDNLNSEGIKGLKLHRKGTILFPKSGASTFLNHRVLMEVDGYVSSHLATIKAKGEIADDKFLLYYLTTIDSKDLMQNVAYPSLKTSDIGLIPVPLPPLSEQKRIVSIIDECFKAIDQAKANTERNLKNARELFDSYLQGVFERRGDDWHEKKLGEIFDVRDGTHESPKYINKGFPMVTSKNLKDHRLVLDPIKYISESDYININKRSKVDVGDVLFAMIGTIGNPVVVEDEPNYAIKNVALFKGNDNQSSNFLKYLLDSKLTKDKMIEDAKGTTQKFVGLGYLRSFPIFIPSLTKQQAIVSQLDALRTETKKLESSFLEKITDLDELKKSILQKAFAGEISTDRAMTV